MSNNPHPLNPEELRRHPLLTALLPEQLERVAATTRIITLANGDTLFHMGETAEAFYWLRQGHIKLFRLSPDGQEKVVEIIRPEQSFAEAVMFMDKRAYPVNAAALDTAQVLVFHANTFMAILRESPDTCFRLLGTLSMRLRHRLSDIDALSLQNAGLRVTNFLLMLHHEQGACFELPVAKKTIAARLSIQPETFSRILHQLEQAGAIRTEGRGVTILKPELLQDPRAE